MNSFPILSAITFLPLLGAILIALFIKGGEDNEAGAKLAQKIALLVSLATFALSVIMLRQFNPADTGFQLVERFVWIPSFNIAYIKGIDGISVWFVMMSALLTPACIMSARVG